MDKQLKQLYEFGPFRLDVVEKLLWRANEVVPLTPKTFDVLLALVEQPGHLLDKATLLKTVWPDSLVEENNLADNISKLRKVLGEGEHKYIETVPRRGYRFVAEVKSLPATIAAPVAAQSLVLSPAQPALRWRHRPEAFLLAGGLLVLLTITAGLYWRSGRVNAEAEQHEFKGNFYLSQWTEAEVRKGLEHYQRAVALAPDSASAHAGLASAWIFLTDSYASPREAMPQAKAAAARALQLDETSARAHVSMGVVKMEYDWDWADADQEFKRALKLEPEFQPAHQLYGWYLLGLGRLEEAQTVMKHQADADALNEFSLWELGLCFYFAHQPEQAIEQYRRAAAVEPRSYWPHLLSSWVYAQEGKNAEALAEAERARRLNDGPQTLAAIGYARAVANQRVEAQQVLTELQDLARHKYVSPYDVATIYAGLGDSEQVLVWLEKACQDRSGWLALWLKVDPKFDHYRKAPRFHNLLQRVGLVN